MNKDNHVIFSNNSFENLIFLPVTLNGITVTAMFDTGAQLSFISKSVSEKLGEYSADSPLKGGNNQGHETAFETVSVKNVAIGNFSFAQQRMGVLPDQALDFGEDSRQNRFPAAMLLGWDLISQLCWEFDMQSKTVQVCAGGSLPKGDDLSWGGFPIVTIMYGGESFAVGFDSGHTESFLDSTWLSRLEGLKQSQSLVQGIGSETVEDVNIAERLCFTIKNKEIFLSNIEVANHEVYGATDDRICALLGADILQCTKWILDYKSSRFEIIE